MMIYLFVLDDSLTSLRFTTRTEKLTKCYETLQKLRVRLGACKTGLCPPVTLFYVLVFKIFCAVGALCMFLYF